MAPDRRPIPEALPESAEPRGVLRVRDLKNLAGLLTLARLPLAFVFPFVAADRWLALLVYLLAAGTDVADGIVARRTGTTSHTGSALDGALDKVFHVNAAWSLAVVDAIPGWWLLCWFSREIVQLPMVFWLARPFLRGQVRPYEAVQGGKLLTIGLAVATVASILGLPVVGAMLTPLLGAGGLLIGLVYLRRSVREQQELRRSPSVVPEAEVKPPSGHLEPAPDPR